MAVVGKVLSYYGDTISFQEPYLEATSAGTSPLVPGYLGISIGGRGYAAETSFTPFKQDAYRSDSISPVADKTDITNIPGEGSVNTEGLWRREMQDWSDGAGQLFLDRRASQDNRFLKSKGIYPWTQWYASLLNDTTPVHASGTELQVLTAGGFVYINDGGTVRYSSGNLSTWNAVAGVTAATTSAALTTDGNNVYIAAGSNGVYLITTPGSTAAQWITGTVNYVWYAGGALMCAAGAALYNVTTSTGTAGPTALPSALYTQPNGHFTWTSCAAGNSWIYISGYTSNTSANQSLVYKTQQNATGTGLIVPITAATLPGGELVVALYAYANFIMVGTTLGARFCETLGINDPGGNAGDLKMGPIVPDQIQQVTKPVRAFVGQFRWIWFSWSNYDALSTGLGRLDLSTFIDQQSPAYTSDLMVSGAGEIVSADWYNGLNNVEGVTTGSPLFVVSGSGVYTAATTLVPEGTIDTGYITAGLPDDKISLFVDLNASGSGSIGGLVTVDDITTFPVPIQQVANQLAEQALPTSLKGELFDLQVNLFPNSAKTAGPTLRRLMMKFLPCVVSATQHKVIINLFATAETLGVDQAFFAYQEFAILDGLRQSSTPVQYVEGTQFNVTVVIKSITRLPYNEHGLPEGGFNQRFELVLQTLEN